MVEEIYESDWSKLKPGVVSSPLVLEAQKRI
jgi:hypothetical protein